MKLTTGSKASLAAAGHGGGTRQGIGGIPHVMWQARKVKPTAMIFARE